MPLVRVALCRGKSAEYKKTLTDSLYQAMREAFAVPEHCRFILIDEYEPDNFIFSPDYLNIQRTTELVIIQITCNNTRNLEQKKALYIKISEILNKNLELREEDILINLVEVPKENWSMGKGVATYA